jgi:hypothetical protein
MFLAVLNDLRQSLPSMPGQSGERGGEVAFVDASETGETAHAGDEHFIPDAARVS